MEWRYLSIGTNNHKRQACFYANVLRKKGYLINFSDRNEDIISIERVGN